jgi:hypothetical protein
MAEQDTNAEALVEEGLKHYGQGKLDEALARWREALALVPDHNRAREYLKYVEDNRGALEDSFRVARGATGPAAPAVGESGPPAAAAPADAQDLEVEFVVDAPSGPSTPERETDPSFVRFAEEIASTAAAVETEVPRFAAEKFDEDYTPRIDLAELKAKVAETKRRLTGDLTAVGRHDAVAHDAVAAAPADVRSPADLDTAMVLTLGRPKPAVVEDLSGGWETPPHEEVPHEVPPRGEPPREEPPREEPPREDARQEAREGAARGGAAAPPPARDVPTPSGLTPAVVPIQHRDRRATPLTLIAGGATAGSSPAADFEPMEATPVGTVIPEPSRLRSEGLEPLADAEEASDELERAPDLTTPARLQKAEKQPTKRPSDLGLAAVGGPAAAEPRGDESRGAEREGASTAIGLGPRDGPLPGATPTPTRTTLALGSDRPAATRSTTPLGIGLAEGQTTPTGKPSEQRLESMISGAQQLFEQGTFEGSLWLCERVIAVDPEHKAAKELLERNKQILLLEYRKQVGDKQQVPVVQVPQHEIVWHKLDHRAGFLLSRIDGQLSYEDLLDVSGMTEFEAFRILSQLLAQGVIGKGK